MRYRACFLLLSVIIYPVFFSARLPAEAPARADKATESNLAALEKGGESSLFEDIMFRATFDGAVDANLFKGEPKAKTEGRIVFEQGVFGKAIAVGERYATLIYKVGTSSRAPNMSFRSGSISFWFKPVDWEPSEKRPHVFYRAGRGALSRIFTDAHGNLVFETGTDLDQKRGVRASLSGLKRGEWIHVAATWSPREIRLYLNKKLAAIAECDDRFLSHAVKTDFLVGDVPRGMGREKARKTLIDDFTIYDRPLGPDELDRVLNPASAGKAPRYAPPLVAVTVAAKPPVVDGVFDAGEWSAAAELTNFANVSDFRLAPIQTRAYVTYDRENIYVAVLSPVLPGVPLTAACKKRDRNVWQDDAVQLYLTVPSGNRFHFVGNSVGTIFDRKYTKGIKDDVNWNGNWRYANKVGRKQWTAEISISFRELGVDVPADGETWRLNITRDRVRPRNLSAWPALSAYADTARHGRLVFRASGASVVRAPSFDGIIGKRVRLEAAIGGASVSSAEKLSVKWLAAAAGKVLFERTDRVELKPGGELSLALSEQLKAAPDMFVFTVSEAKSGKVVYHNTGLFGRREALRIDLYPVPSKGVCKTTVKVNDRAVTAANPRAFVQLIPQGSHTSVAEARIARLEDGRGATEFPIADLEPGAYDVRVEIKAFGKTLLARTKRFVKPKEPWRGTKVGLSDSPPPPWTPIRADRASDGTLTVSCWNRTHVFNGAPLPASIDNGGEKVLAGPITIDAKVDGAEQTWANGKMRVVERNKNRISFTAHARSRALSLSGKTYMEFDGMLWTEITIKPRAKCRLDALDLVVPIKSRYAKYRHWPGDTPLTGAVGRKDGWRWRHALPKRAFLWLGNDDLGLTWFFETWSQYRYADPNSTVELVRSGGALHLKIHYVGKPVLPEKPLTLAFGLQATPTRPRPKGWRSWGGGNIVGTNIDIPWTSEYDHRYGAGYPEAANRDYYYRFVKSHRENGWKVVPYCVINWHAEYSPEMRYHLADWDLGGGINKYSDARKFWWGRRICGAATSYHEFFAWKARRFVENNHLDGLYHDLQWSFTCANPNHGPGEAHRAIRGDRELNKRIYTMMKRFGRPLWKVDHASNQICSVTSPFSDIFTTGEEMMAYPPGGKHPDYKVRSNYFHNMRLDYFKACGATGRQWGVAPMFLIQMTSSSPGYTEALYSILLAHDAIPVWEAWMKDIRYMRCVQRTLEVFGIGADDVEFLPYWHEDTPAKVKLRPKGGGPLRPFQVKYEVREESRLRPEEAFGASIYRRRRGKRSLIVVFNYTEDDCIAELKIDPDALGLKGERVLATDAFTRFSWVRADRELVFPVKSLNYRLVWVEELELYDYDRARIVDEFPAYPRETMLAGYRPSRPELKCKGFEVVGDLRRNPWSEGAGSYTGPQRSELAETFTLKKRAKVHRVEVRMRDSKGVYALRKPVRLSIVAVGADGLPGEKTPARRKDFAPIWVDSRNWRYAHYELLRPVELEAGKYALVFSKPPEAPEEFFHAQMPSLDSAKLPGEYVIVRESPPRRTEGYGWQKVPGRVIAFGVYGYESPR